MTKTLPLFFLAIFFVIYYGSYAQSGKFIVQNPSGVARIEDPLVLSRATLEGLVSVPQDGKTAELYVDGQLLPSQLDDVNGDGKWDELAFLATVNRNTNVEVKIKWVSVGEEKKVPKRTQVWFGVSENRDGKFQPVTSELRPETWTPQQQPPRYQMEGPGWENDKVAFRNYFDSRNGIDIFGKTTSRLVLDSVDGSYLDYHHICPWGMDILKVGPSLGAGAFALVDKGNLFPLQQTGSAFYRQISNGPVRSVFELIYEGWKVGDEPLNAKQRISIWAGKYWYSNEVTITGFSGQRELAIGIVNLKNPNPAIYNTHNKKYLSLASHARQSENDDFLGMGILFQSAVFSGYGEAPKIQPWPQKDTVSHTFYGKIKIRSGEPAQYQFFAAWEKTEARFGNARYFLDLIQEEADRREFPLIISKK